MKETLQLINSLCMCICVYVCMGGFGEGVGYLLLLNQNKTQGMDYFTVFDLDWFLTETFPISCLYAAWKLIWYTGLKINTKSLLVSSCVSSNIAETTLGEKTKQLFTTKSHLQSYL